MLWLLILFALVQVALPLALFLVRNRLMFLPSATPTAEDRISEFRGLDAKVVKIKRPDGRSLDAYDAQPIGAVPSGPVVLFFHGNAGNIANRAGLVAWMVKITGARVILASYSGYGGNEGSPSEAAVYEDSIAAYDWLRSQGVSGNRIVIFGESIGGAPASFVASEREAAGLVLQCSFSSLTSMALRTYPWLPLCALFTLGSMPVAERVANLRIPVLVAHGKADQIVPFSEGQRIHAAAGARGELYHLDGANHNDFFERAGEAYLRHLRQRFSEWTRP